MKFFCMLSTFFKSKVILNRGIHALKITNTNIFKLPLTRKKFIIYKTHAKFLQSDSDNEDLNEYLSGDENEIDCNKSTRNIIFKNYEDNIISELNSCASVEEVLDVVTKRINVYQDKHATQTILVLKDLQNIINQYNSFDTISSNMFLESLKENEGFLSLLRCIKEKLDDFNPNYLTYVLFYLNKLGISVEDDFMQSIVLKVRNNLLNNFCLDQCSRFLTCIFYENSVRPYYLSVSIIPLVINCIDKCTSVDELHNLSVCLNKLHNIITTELLERYKLKVAEFLKNKKLTGGDYSTLLKIISLLNYPNWRDRNVLLISDCILLLEDEISQFNVEDLTTLYEVFFKNQEPGKVLNSIQRCSAKFLHRLDESEETSNITRLKLFSSLIYFSSPVHRIQFRKHAPKYLIYSNNYRALVHLRKIFSYVKISDSKLCATYWNLCFKVLNENVEQNIVLKLCHNYMYFNTDINNYRHYKFEDVLMDHIEKTFLKDPLLNPTKILGYLSFVMLYGRKENIFKLLLDKFEENMSRVNATDCLRLSHSVSLLNSGGSTCMAEQDIAKIKTLLNRCTKHLLELDEDNYLQNSMLLKASVLRSDDDTETLDHLLVKFKEMDFMSSKILENICYALTLTQSLIPELINKCTEYVVKHKNNILGFNAEKLAFMCYYLAYYPVNGNAFFEAVSDIIIRDQERLSGLAFLQTALSLCYFNKLPSSFVKQIFNVEFLEKLDAELENCYSREKYPQRVRNTLMMLNRAVCLEYPEYNVPWFHKKYIEDVQKKVVQDSANTFHLRVKEYLSQALGTHKYTVENLITPYGYHIDFVLNLNIEGEVVPSDSPDVSRRVALLLLRQHAFTRSYIQLIGKYQQKIRHLEILGYEVATVNFNEWINLLYGEERLEYITKLIWPNGKEIS